MGVLALIPARKGSRGIPGKALQLVDGVPMILRTIEAVKAAAVAERIVVTTDCPQIAGFCRLRNVEVLDRPTELAADDVPLRPVIDHAITELGWQGVTAVLQPTCPLLRHITIRRVIEEFEFRQLAWAITGSPEPHIFWKDNAPLVDRVNRQQADGRIMRESGAIQLVNPAGDGEAIIHIRPEEACDIDTPAELKQARDHVGARTIRFTVTASDRLGSGHYWRCLRLADELTVAGHRVEWVWANGPDVPAWAVETIVSRGYGERSKDLSDLRIYDMLDAGRRVVADKSVGVPTVVFEDHGPAREWADLAIDEMTDGPKWAVLRPEFACLPEHDIRPGHRVLVTFGGTDPSGLSARVQRRLAPVPGIDVRTVTPGMQAHMAEEMLNADLVITGQGRTVFEAAACGVPCMSIAANEREARHVRIPGVLYLGLHSLLSDSDISGPALRALQDRSLREDLSRTSRAQIDGLGVDRIMHAIDGLLRGL